ncbi:type VI secretion system baseplate subunit TssK [Uliginosibacterium sp. H3]|uniref:Type VI secretion system baseplate subunit TssK n=1 Tax=Uliginosibacterium silvisoli TaxID=3114758 RepID=A0ABU6K400_9RHOO|nr:type VI secretion system baseplate subunit TssK [Uliginosibacterium sp. H3]
MKTVQKLLWGEGLFLKPQHFQQQDLYHEQRVAAAMRAAHPYLWGVVAQRLDRRALENGVLRFSELQVVWPDGDTLDAPEVDGLPEARNLADIDVPADGLVFHLALPFLREDGGNFGASGRSAASGAYTPRYAQGGEPAPDLYTQAVSTELTVLRKQARLLADHEPREQFVSIPIARVRRTATGGFEFDAMFMPPALRIEALPTLSMLLRNTLDMLQAKCNALYGHHREPSKHVIEFRSGDVASFWLLHTASTAFAQLSHYFHHPQLHPERLYQSLLGLAGQLLTFSKAYALTDLPPYDHLEPGPAFLALDKIIRELINTVISARFVTINLSETKPGHFHGRLESEKLSGASLYLAVGADMPPAELVDAVPMRLKLGSPDDVEKLVLSAMPGVKLMAAPQVPASIPVRPGSYYFSIEPHGPIFDRMLQAQSIAIYVPSGFKELKLELMAVIE